MFWHDSNKHRQQHNLQMCWQRQKFKEKSKQAWSFALALVVKTNKTPHMANSLFNVACFPEHSFQGLHPSPLSPGLVSPEADLCGESSRHHTSIYFPFLFVDMNSTLHRTFGTVAHRLKDRAKQGLKCNQMALSVMLGDRFLHIYISLPAEEGGSLFLRDDQSNQNSFKNRFST